MHDELQVKTVIWLGFGGGGGKVGFRSEFVRRFHLNGSVCEGLIKVIVVSTVHYVVDSALSRSLLNRTRMQHAVWKVKFDRVPYLPSVRFVRFAMLGIRRLDQPKCPGHLGGVARGDATWELRNSPLSLNPSVPPALHIPQWKHGPMR